MDPSRDYGFVAVAAGEGLKSVFTDLAADAVVSGGQTMNPSTEDILAAIQSVPAKTVFVPVSYTHLDVYKRQGSARGSWSFRPDRPRWPARCRRSPA